jgi:hypothetical protein
LSEILIYPSYFPSIASMAAMSQASNIVFEVEDNYQKQTYRNRSYIAHSNGKLLLTIPITHQKEKESQKTKEVVPENDFPWLAQHWKSVQSAYRTSPYFEFYEDDLSPLFSKPVTNLQAFNLLIIKALFELIGMEVPTERSSEYLTVPKQKDLRHLVVCKREKKFRFETYHQVFEETEGYIENLSVLDLLFNEGPNSLSYLERQKL